MSHQLSYSISYKITICNKNHSQKKVIYKMSRGEGLLGEGQLKIKYTVKNPLQNFNFIKISLSLHLNLNRDPSPNKGYFSNIPLLKKVTFEKSLSSKFYLLMIL